MEKNILLIGAVLGPITSLIGWIAEGDDPWALLIFVGAGVSLACLVLFGLVALYAKPLPRWNVLPLLAGAWYPIVIFYYMIVLMTTGEEMDSLSALAAILLTVQCIALIALGYVLKSDVPEETVAVA